MRALIYNLVVRWLWLAARRWYLWRFVPHTKGGALCIVIPRGVRLVRRTWRQSVIRGARG